MRDDEIGRRNDYKSERRQEVYDYVQAHPDKTYREVAERFGCSRELVGRYMRQMGVNRASSRVSRRLFEDAELLAWAWEKWMEEAGEVWLAAEHEGDEALAEEISQLLYWVQVLMVGRGLRLEDVYRHL